jgi:kinesin family protein 18/19
LFRLRTTLNHPQATGCGKTHTISGVEDDPGIIYMTMADLFQRIEDRRDEYNVDVMVTFLEIYNEEIRDLLAEPGTHAPRGGLSIREDKTVKVVGLVELKPTSAEEVKEIVLQGNARRTQSPTHANETSSRSHAVLQVHITQSPRTASVTEQRTMATLSIIDLAGSERAAATMNMGQRMVEGANINKSLLALGNCINALCESGGAIRHVPYRNSKLTRLLKFSLGGNCKTVMIVCVAPTSNHFDDTHNTLLYAERATKIKTKVVTRNVVNVDRHVGRYVEAINKLNLEVAELKAKLAGKINTEIEIQRRKRAEANAEMERSKKDIKVKVEQTRASILDGATCMSKLTVANLKLKVIRARLQQIETSSPATGSLSPDLQAERALLQALAEPAEQVTRPGSALNVRLQRSTNAMAMFDATLRAVSERKSDKLDDVGVDGVRLDARCKKAEMEQARAEEDRDVMRGAVEGMANVVVTLLGMLARCTVMAGEAGRALDGSIEGGGNDGTATTVKKVAASMKNVKEKNDAVFMELVGHSTEAYTSNTTAPALFFDGFSGHSTTFTRRMSAESATQSRQINSKRLSFSASGSRRLSVHDAGDAGHSPGRQGHRSPRKSLRSSLAGAPYRRVSDETRERKHGKNVQWKDEVGQGDLDDRAAKATTWDASISPVVISVTAADASGSTALPQRQMSPESEWEDETEKTDDSPNASFVSTSDTSTLLSSRLLAAAGSKRPRASRLDPSFLKMRSKGSVLGSLAEDDEDESPVRRSQTHPLADRSLNQLSTPDTSSSISGNRRGSANGGLHVPKARDRHVITSPKRSLSAPRVAGLAGKSGRRKSGIGGARIEKGRRRSSLIPHPPPTNGEGNKDGPRRVLLAERSPAKRTKRMSMLGNNSMLRSATIGSIRSKIGSTSMSGLMDLNGSADLSFGKSKPTWR